MGSASKLQGAQLLARASSCPGNVLLQSCSADSGWSQPGIQNSPPAGSCIKTSVNVTFLILPAWCVYATLFTGRSLLAPPDKTVSPLLQSLLQPETCLKPQPGWVMAIRTACLQFLARAAFLSSSCFLEGAEWHLSAFTWASR